MVTNDKVIKDLEEIIEILKQKGNRVISVRRGVGTGSVKSYTVAYTKDA